MWLQSTSQVPSALHMAAVKAAVKGTADIPCGLLCRP